MGGRAHCGVPAAPGTHQSSSCMAVGGTSLVPSTPRATCGAAGHSAVPRERSVWVSEFGTDLSLRWGLFRGAWPQAPWQCQHPVLPHSCPVAPRDSVQGGSAPGEPRLAMGTVQTGSRGSAVSAVLKIPLQRAWRPTFLPQLEPGSSACCGLGTDTGNEGSTTWCPPACPHPGPCCRGSQGRSGMLWDS